MEAQIITSDTIGIKGENGERFCVFFYNERNPIDSAWTWTDTREQAQAIINQEGKQHGNL